jgi:hypothetical protein
MTPDSCRLTGPAHSERDQAELESNSWLPSPGFGGSQLLSVDTVFFKRMYVLIYMHLARTRVLLAACTANPNEASMAQQASNLAWTLEDEGIELKAGSFTLRRQPRFPVAAPGRGPQPQ